MTSDRGVDPREIGVILRTWRDAGHNLYAVVFDERGMQACAGCVSSVDDENAMITDSFVDLRIPYASAGDCAVVTLAEHKRSVTLTWHDGTNAFIATRDVRGSGPHSHAWTRAKRVDDLSLLREHHRLPVGVRRCDAELDATVACDHSGENAVCIGA